MKVVPGNKCGNCSTLQWRHNGRLKSPASGLFTQPFIQTRIKENIKAPRHWPLCGEFTSHRWIPHKWPVTRKMFPFDDVIMILQQSYVFCNAYNSWEFQDGRILEWGIGKGGVTFTQSGTNPCFILHMYIFEQNSLYCILHGCSLDTFSWYIFMSLLITWFAILSPGS